MISCACAGHERADRIVLTGGPGAGKTAVLELIRQHFCRHVDVLPETATILFGGGFPRGGPVESLRAAQRAIYHVQRELEAAAEARNEAAILLCDRGTVDSAAYWPGPGDLFTAVGARREEELLRYRAVIHLRVPAADAGYDQSNPLRIESAAQAAALDLRISEAWQGHPRRHVVDSQPDFLSKAKQALDILRTYLPDCCRRHVVPALDGQIA